MAIRRKLVVAAALATASAIAMWPLPALADPSPPAVEQRRQSPAHANAQTEYDRGVRARVAGDFPVAVDAFRRAIALRADFADAWNELGYALRKQGRYAESVTAYDEALRLRPDFPEALEYLGEAYVQSGQIEEARRVLARLRPLDPRRAQTLADIIAKPR